MGKQCDTKFYTNLRKAEEKHEKQTDEYTKKELFNKKKYYLFFQVASSVISYPKGLYLPYV